MDMLSRVVPAAPTPGPVVAPASPAVLLAAAALGRCSCSTRMTGSPVGGAGGGGIGGAAPCRRARLRERCRSPSSPTAARPMGAPASSPVATAASLGPGAGFREAGDRRSGGDGLALRMRLLGADPAADAEPLARLPGEVNYLVGERRDWRTNIPPTSESATTTPGPGSTSTTTETAVASNTTSALRPGPTPAGSRSRSPARTRFGSPPTATSCSSHRRAQSASEPRAPTSEIDGRRVVVDAGYTLDGERTVALRLGAYDASRPLVIDPLLMTYSTFLGGPSQRLRRARDRRRWLRGRLPDR